jgi:PAS domain S-box-containing protein
LSDLKEKLFRQLYRQHPSMQILVDPENGDIIDVSDAACLNFNSSNRDILKINISDIFDLQSITPETFLADCENSDQPNLYLSPLLKTTSTSYLEVIRNFVVLDNKTYLNITFNDNNSVISSDETKSLDRYNKLYTCLYNISRASTSSESLNDILDIVYNNIMYLYDADNYYIVLYDQRTEMYKMERMYDCSDVVDLGKSYPLKSGLVEYVRKNGPLLISNEGDSDNLESAGYHQIGKIAKSWIGVPFKVKDKFLGVIALYKYDENNAYKKSDINILELIGNQVAHAIAHYKWRDSLESSENRYRKLFNQSPVGICIYDKDMEIIEVNESCQLMFGLTNETLIGYSMANLAQDNLIPFVKDSLIGRTSRWEGQYKSSLTGIKLSLSATLSPFFNESNQIAGGMAVIEDKTKTDKAEQRAELNRVHLEQLFSKVPEAIVMMDLNLKVIKVNKEFCATFQYSVDEVIGRSIEELIFPLNKIGLEHIDNLNKVTHGELLNVDEIVCRRKDHSHIYTSMLGTPVRVKEEIIAIYAIYRDISIKKQTVDELAYEKDRLSVTLASIVDGVITTDVNGRVLIMNESAQSMVGWNAKEAVGETLDKIFSISDDNQNAPFLISIRDINDAAGMRNHNYESQIYKRDGTKIPISGSTSPILDSNNKIIGLVLVFRDISNQKKFEEEAAKIERLESIGVLAGGIAHDFNNILAAVLGNISIAQLPNQGLESITERLEEAEKATLRAKDLTHQLLTFSRGGAPVRSTIDILELIEDESKFALRGSNVKAEIFCENNIKKVNVDKGQISRVLNNIILNGNQAMPDGGTIRIYVSNIQINYGNSIPLKPGNYVYVSIQDEGEGINSSIIKKIFDPFFTTKNSGSGLGLATSFSIVQKHGGLLTAESCLGESATFTIYLPISEGEVAEELRDTNSSFKGTGNILIMDDEPSVLSVTENMLTSLGFSVTTSIDGTEAIEKYSKALLANDPFRAVIMDLTIPGGMGGLEALENIKIIDRNVVAIVASGYSNAPVMSEYKKYGFRGVIEKPFRVENLIETLDKVLSQTVDS